MMKDWEKRKRRAEPPNYGFNSVYFSIHWHDMKRSTEGGLIDCGFIDFCSAEKISMAEVNFMATKLGLIASKKTYYWLQPKQSVPNGLRTLATDHDAAQMCVFIDDSRILDVYSVDIINVEVEDGTVVCQVDGEGSQSEDIEPTAEDSDVVDSDYEVMNDDRELREDDDFLFNQFVDRDVERNMPETHATESDTDSIHSKYASSDEVDSDCASNEEGDVISKPKFPMFKEKDMVNPSFVVGMRFSSFKQFKDAVKKAAVLNRREVIFNPNNKQKCKAKCKKGCPFFIWTYLMSDKSTIQIKSAKLEHTCLREHSLRHVNANFVAKTYLERFRADATWKLVGIKAAVQQEFEVEISRLTAWRARNIALAIIDGDEIEQLSKLHDYKLELLKTNPGSTINFQLDEGVFRAMYVCLAGLKEGFKDGCRRLISIDGCFLKGMFGGQLLSAVGIDANDNIYPIAWAVVPTENKEYWTWFLEYLAEDLEINNSHHWSFMSDRQKGLIPAIEELFPHSEHRFCVRHIKANFKRRFNSKELREVLVKAAKASYVQYFDKIMVYIASQSTEAHDYLNKIGSHHWTRSHFRDTPKCDMILNNLCECFNSLILDARLKGVITMNEIIRTQLMRRIHKKRDAMLRNGGQYCPKILAKLEKAKKISWLYKADWSGGNKFQVEGPFGQFVVDKYEKTCTCRRWDISGIPCAHAVCAIRHDNDKPGLYLDDCFKVSTYLRIYSHLIYPTSGRELWPKSGAPPVQPPTPVKKKRGKKATMRRKEPDEVSSGIKNGKVIRKGMDMNCSYCGLKGHNKRQHGLIEDDPSSQQNAIDSNSIDIQMDIINEDDLVLQPEDEAMLSQLEESITQLSRSTTNMNVIAGEELVRTSVIPQKFNYTPPTSVVVSKTAKKFKKLADIMGKEPTCAPSMTRRSAHNNRPAGKSAEKKSSKRIVKEKSTQMVTKPPIVPAHKGKQLQATSKTSKKSHNIWIPPGAGESGSNNGGT